MHRDETDLHLQIFLFGEGSELPKMFVECFSVSLLMNIRSITLYNLSPAVFSKLDENDKMKAWLQERLAKRSLSYLKLLSGKGSPCPFLMGKRRNSYFTATLTIFFIHLCSSTLDWQILYWFRRLPAVSPANQSGLLPAVTFSSALSFNHSTSGVRGTVFPVRLQNYNRTCCQNKAHNKAKKEPVVFWEHNIQIEQSLIIVCSYSFYDGG